MTSDHQKGCCTRCKEIQIVKGKPLHEGGGYPFMVCNNAACSCHKELADNTAEPSIREGFKQSICEVVPMAEFPMHEAVEAAIMTAFDSALEQIAVEVGTHQKSDEAPHDFRAPFNAAIGTAAAIIRSNKSS